MGVSKLTLLGYAILAWSGVVALAAWPMDGTRWEGILVAAAILGASGGVAVAIVGAARHDNLI